MTKTRTEYRVVGEDFRGEAYKTEPVHRLAGAEYDLETWKTGHARNGRIQSRTVTETPWQDIDESEES